MGSLQIDKSNKWIMGLDNLLKVVVYHLLLGDLPHGSELVMSSKESYLRLHALSTHLCIPINHPIFAGSLNPNSLLNPDSLSQSTWWRY